MRTIESIENVGGELAARYAVNNGCREFTCSCVNQLPVNKLFAARQNIVLIYPADVLFQQPLAERVA